MVRDRPLNDVSEKREIWDPTVLPSIHIVAFVDGLANNLFT